MPATSSNGRRHLAILSCLLLYGLGFCFQPVHGFVIVRIFITAGTSTSDCDAISSDDAVWGAAVNSVDYFFFHGEDDECPDLNPEEDGEQLLFFEAKACDDQRQNYDLCLIAGDDDSTGFSCEQFGAIDADDLGCKVEDCERYVLPSCAFGGSCDFEETVQFNIAGDDNVRTKRVKFDVRRTGDCFTDGPTVSPTSNPVVSPTPAPTLSPTSSPSTSPIILPTNAPTVTPSVAPSSSPTVNPTANPTETPTTGAPTTVPSSSPTTIPTVSPTASPLPCAAELKPCGGTDHVGVTCCQGDLECFALSPELSLCNGDTSAPVGGTDGGEVDTAGLDSMTIYIYAGAAGGGLLLLLLITLLFFRTKRKKDEELEEVVFRRLERESVLSKSDVASQGQVGTPPQFESIGESPAVSTLSKASTGAISGTAPPGLLPAPMQGGQWSQVDF